MDVIRVLESFKSKRLIKLDLSWNQLGLACVNHIVDKMKKCELFSSLEHLGLASSSLSLTNTGLFEVLYHRMDGAQSDSKHMLFIDLRYNHCTRMQMENIF